MMNDVWIIDAARSPRGIGKQGKGGLASLHPQELLAQVLSALAKRNNVNTAEVDDVIIGCSSQIQKQGSCIARMSALAAGFDVAASGVTIDRFCGSGLSAISMAAASIGSGYEDMIFAGGVEMMSHTIVHMPPLHIDSGNLSLRNRYPMSNVGLAADIIAKEEGITRTELDAFGVQSQQRTSHAQKFGYFQKSLIAIYNDDGTLALSSDELPRPGTTLEGLSQLSSPFSKVIDVPLDETGITYRQLIHAQWPNLEFDFLHHAGTSSGVVDGAAGLILASPAYAKANGLQPRAKIKMVANSGGSPAHILNQPVPATQKALKRAGMTTADIDLFEINEAFAVVALKFIRDLNLNPDLVNVNGGAIALGHPIGATGAMLVGTALDELERRDTNSALITMCAAGGMAPAMIIERL